ncbi:hypothetical protein ACJX0J_010655, partial [Zea mays]
GGGDAGQKGILLFVTLSFLVMTHKITLKVTLDETLSLGETSHWTFTMLILGMPNSGYPIHEVPTLARQEAICSVRSLARDILVTQFDGLSTTKLTFLEQGAD